MEPQLILLSAILTPLELCAAGAMFQEPSGERSFAPFSSSATRGSACDPAAARPGPSPTRPGDRPMANSRARFESTPSLGYGRGGAGAPATGSRQLLVTQPRTRDAVSEMGPQEAGLGRGAGLGTDSDGSGSWGSREEAEHRPLHLKRTPHPEFFSSATLCRRPSCSQKKPRAHRCARGPRGSGLARSLPFFLPALSPEVFFPRPSPRRPAFPRLVDCPGRTRSLLVAVPVVARAATGARRWGPRRGLHRGRAGLLSIPRPPARPALEHQHAWVQTPLTLPVPLCLGPA